MHAIIIDLETFEMREATYGEAIQMVAAGFIIWCEKHQCYHAVADWQFVDQFLGGKRTVH